MLQKALSRFLQSNNVKNYSIKQFKKKNKISPSKHPVPVQRLVVSTTGVPAIKIFQ